MQYAKPAISFADQADLLISRGLIANRDELIRRLEAVNYYRLSGYLYPFRQRITTPNAAGKPTITVIDQFKTGTTLTEVWDRYRFDRQLRLLLMDAIERIEVSVRTRMVYEFTLQHGAFGHLSHEHLPKLKVEEYLSWRAKLVGNAKKSKEEFVEHFFKKYQPEHQELPLWILCELMDFGGMQSFYRGMSDPLRQTVAKSFGLSDELMDSWLRALNTVRNACAHHSRVWNRVWGTAVKLPLRNKFPDWNQVWDNSSSAWIFPTRKPRGGVKPPFSQDRTGVIMTICNYLLGKVAHTSQWKIRVLALFAKYPNIPLQSMGLPPQWLTHPLWK